MKHTYKAMRPKRKPIKITPELKPFRVSLYGGGSKLVFGASKTDVYNRCLCDKIGIIGIERG